MPTINIKPLSVNQAWEGQRFKTKLYKSFESSCLLLLPKNNVNLTGELELNIEYGFSNKLSDIDNPTKMILDIMQKKYKFNDSQIYVLNIVKKIVKKDF